MDMQGLDYRLAGVFKESKGVDALNKTRFLTNVRHD